MNRKRVVTFLAVCFLFTVTVYASYAWVTHTNLSTPHTFKAVWDYDNGAHKVKVRIDRSAYNPTTGTVRVSASVDVDEPKSITSIIIQSGEDSNNNGNIEANEWATRATGSVTNTVSSSIATVPSTDIDVKFDGYRLTWTWVDGGIATEEILAPGITATP